VAGAILFGVIWLALLFTGQLNALSASANGKIILVALCSPLILSILLGVVLLVLIAAEQ
jgi:hypothetical protein